MELPFCSNPCDIRDRLETFGHVALLDSGGSERGDWDIIAVSPASSPGLTLPSTSNEQNDARKIEAWAELAMSDTNKTSPIDPNQSPEGCPFTGGIIGFLSYELGRRQQGLSPREGQLPLAELRYYPWAVVQNLSEQRSWLVGDFDTSIGMKVEQALASPEISLASSFTLLDRFQSHWSKEQFRDVFATVKDYLLAGDCYQINIGQAFTAPFAGDLADAYRRLRDIAEAPFSACIPMAGGHLLSLSPERFLSVTNGKVETRPIKGTRPRHADPVQDAQASSELLASEKERAENLMIVDLLRNDIGRFCMPGSVEVEQLFRVESYATVHHLVSVVSGELSASVSPLALLLGCMPGGSITGAPKRRAMEIIDELETASRELWCGSLFYLSNNGRMDSNIAIRTLYNSDDSLHCWAGGGLVIDSEADPEYEEQRDKIGAFLAELELDLAQDR